MNRKANGMRGSPQRKGRDPVDPPAPPLVKQWRKLDRQSPCWMLAFAVPSARALAAAARHGPIVVQHGQSAPFGSARARLLRLLSARLAALGSSALPFRQSQGHWVPCHRLGCSS